MDNTLRDLDFFQLINFSYNEDGDTLINQNLTNSPLQIWLNDIKLAGRRYFSNANFGHLLLVNITPNISVNQLCYQIDRSDFPVFDREHKSIWLLLQSDAQQFNLLETQIGVSEVAKEICSSRSRLHKTYSSLDDIYQNLFATNIALYDQFRPNYIEPSKEKSISLVNLTKNKPTTGISAVDQKVLSTFSRLTLYCIEPDEKTDKQINLDYDVISLVKAIENMDVELVRRILNANGDLVNKYADDDLTPLFYAIRTENKQLVELLIQYNVDVNQSCDDDRQTPLMLAVQLNLVDIVLILLENDADLQTTNLFGQSAIVYYAILYKTKPRLIELLLYWGSNTDYLDSDGRSLLSLACVNADSNLEIVRLLINCGLDLFHRDNYGKSILHLASVHATNYELIEYLVEIGGEDLICIRDNEGKMPIHYAVIYGCNSILHLLSCKHNINSMSLDGCSPLRTAALEFQYDCLHTLIDCCGADINSLDLNGRTTLYYLASICNDNPEILEMMKELIKLGANLELCAAEKTTALHIACFKGFEKTVTLLLSAGAEVSSVDSEQRNALHLVCASTGNTNIMRKLIKHAIEIDAYTSQGSTPLQLATQQGQYDACKLLLEYGANVWHRDEFGQNVRDILISCNHSIKMRKLFEKYFGIIGNSECDVSFDSQQQQQQQPKTLLYPEICSPVSNSNKVNLSSTNNLSFNLSVDREDGATYNSMQGEGRSWIGSVDLASYQGSGQNLSTCSPLQSTYNMSYFNNPNNLKMNNPLGGSHNHLVANPKLLSPNCFQRSDSSDLTTKKDKRNKFSRFF